MLVGEDEAHILSRQLYRAAALGHVQNLCKILLGDVDPDWHHPLTGLTCLQVAALEGRAECVRHLLLAGADIYATNSQDCTALDLYAQNKLLVRVLDKLVSTRNYKGCLEYLEKADADCQRRFHETTEYQGVVVIHPSDELGLVCLPARKALVGLSVPDDSPSAKRCPAGTLSGTAAHRDKLRPHMRHHATHECQCRKFTTPTLRFRQKVGKCFL